MSDVLINLLSFMAAILILVPFHEWGHFLLARLLGVRVLRFSVGFGPVLLRRQWHETEYCLCALPLGGYVKMLDEQEGPVAEQDKPFAFNRQPVWKRFLIVLAGPVFNLLLAFGLFWLVLQLGMKDVVPWISGVVPDSPAAQAGLLAGDEILGLNHQNTPTRKAVERSLLLTEFTADQPTVWRVRRGEETVSLLGRLPLESGAATLQQWGVQLDLPPVIGEVLPNQPAAAAGLQPGDRVLAVNGVPISSWGDLVATISKNPHAVVPIKIERANEMREFTVQVGARANDQGYMGVVLPTTYQRTFSLHGWSAVVAAAQQTYELTALHFVFFKEFVKGLAPMAQVGGPIMIAQAAGISAQRGVEDYLDFLAIVSIGLAVLNLLPIPLLDGGHLLYYVLEMLRGKPLSENMQRYGFTMGAVFLILIMGLAFYNDLVRLGW